MKIIYLKLVALNLQGLKYNIADIVKTGIVHLDPVFLHVEDDRLITGLRFYCRQRQVCIT